MREYVLPKSTIYTDEASMYDHLRRARFPYEHKRIRHAEKVYVSGDVHTQTPEGFFSLTKNGIRGVYHSVSTKWLQGYLNEYAWRYNRRNDRRSMFDQLLLRAATDQQP
jgi:transposase